MSAGGPGWCGGPPAGQRGQRPPAPAQDVGRCTGLTQPLDLQSGAVTVGVQLLFALPAPLRLPPFPLCTLRQAARSP